MTSMGLLEKLRAASSKKPGCSVCHWIASQPNAAEWHDVMAAGDISTRVAHDEMKASGFGFSDSPVKTHRTAKHGSR